MSVPSYPTVSRTPRLQTLGCCDDAALPAPAKPNVQTDDLHHVDGVGLLICRGRTLQTREPLAAMAPPSKPAWPKRLWHRLRARQPGIRYMRVDSLRDFLRSGAIDATTTVAFDIDRTLIRFRDDTIPRDRDAWPAVTLPVERQTAQVVRTLQACGVPVFGLTARGPGSVWSNALLTEKQLAAIDVQLATTSPVATCYDHGLMWRAASRSGITYCGYNTKGDVLERLYRKQPMGRVVVLDDQIHNFTSLAEAARSVPFDLTCGYYRHDLLPRERNEDAVEWLWFSNFGA